jgi:hypothetical protein
MEAARTSETSVDNHFTRQYNPEDSSEHHTRRRENLKSQTLHFTITKINWLTLFKFNVPGYPATSTNVFFTNITATLDFLINSVKHIKTSDEQIRRNHSVNCIGTWDIFSSVLAFRNCYCL